jgi:hypothetical protein
MQKIITKEIEAAFKKQGDTSQMSAKDIKIVLKLFNPTGVGEWYIYDEIVDDNGLYMAFVNLGDPEMAECGYVSMQELMEFRGRFNLPLERDKFFKPLSMTLQEVMDKVKRGEHV